MLSRILVCAREDKRARRARLFLLGGFAAWALAVASPLVGGAGALPSCGGNQNIQVAPVTCTGQRTIDGTTFSVVLDVQNGVVTATYTLDAPRPADTPIRIRSHLGISSQPDLNEADGTIPAGATSGSLTTTLHCGQIDVKAVFTGNGDARGRVTAPYITDSTNCEAAPTTTAVTTTVATTTSSPVSSTTTPSSAPSTAPQQPTTTASAGAATTASSGQSRSLPVTGSGDVLALLGAALVAVGVVLATVSRSRPLAE